MIRGDWFRPLKVSKGQHVKKHGWAPSLPCRIRQKFVQTKIPTASLRGPAAVLKDAPVASISQSKKKRKRMNNLSKALTYLESRGKKERYPKRGYGILGGTLARGAGKWG